MHLYTEEELRALKKENYQRRLDSVLEKETKRMEEGGEKKRLLLHSCCGPCSSYCLEYLAEYFEITVFYYNPNITNESEYRHRVEEQKRLAEVLAKDLGTRFTYVEGLYEPKRYFETVKGTESCEEGGIRCVKCFRMRLDVSAAYAAENGYDFFTTTLTISPMKNASVLNALGEEQGKIHGIEFLNSDFKKKNGYQRSIELCKKYDLYRQDFCGCCYSFAERQKQIAEKKREATVVDEIKGASDDEM